MGRRPAQGGPARITTALGMSTVWVHIHYDWSGDDSEDAYAHVHHAMTTSPAGWRASRGRPDGPQLSAVRSGVQIRDRPGEEFRTPATAVDRPGVLL